MTAERWARYDGVAEDYEQALAPIMTAPARDLVAVAAPPEGGSVLDLGTGTGIAAAAALTAVGKAGRVIGLDRSPGMLGAARAHRPAIHLVAGDAARLPFPPATFDAVVANFVLSHLLQLDEALAEARRVLRPRGRFAASAWLRDDDPPQQIWRGLVSDALGPERTEAAKRTAIPCEEQLADGERFAATLTGAGLDVERVDRRVYSATLTLDSYLASRAVLAIGRFARQALPPEEWQALLDRARAELRERLGEQVTTRREALVACARAG